LLFCQAWHALCNTQKAHATYLRPGVSAPVQPVKPVIQHTQPENRCTSNIHANTPNVQAQISQRAAVPSQGNLYLFKGDNFDAPRNRFPEKGNAGPRVLSRPFDRGFVNNDAASIAAAQPGVPGSCLDDNFMDDEILEVQ
jgi:hypothetical protein